MIDQWNILHLKKRTDRKPLALANCERLDVPKEKIEFWYGHDADDFENTEAIIDAAVGDGFAEFSNINIEVPVEPGRICQTYNICRFLRQLSEKQTIEMLIHDGMILRHFTTHALNFYPDFQWLSECVRLCADKRRHPFKMLTVGDLHPYYEIRPIQPGSLISEGVGCTANSIRIYSSLGAKDMLQRILSRIEIYGLYVADRMFKVMPKDPPSDTIFWSPLGMYTLIAQTFACDMPAAFLGSNTVDWKARTGVYQKLFDRWDI